MTDIPASNAPRFSLVAKSPDHDGLMETIVVIPTFRRPDHLLKTLASLRAQLTDRPFATIVVENEAEDQQGAKAVASLFAEGEMRGMVIVAPDRGNCNAYNAGLAAGLEHFPSLKRVLVIDDDEVAERNWMERLIAAADDYNVDLVGGPQQPVFSRPGTNRYESHPVFQPPYRISGVVPMLFSSGNLLIRRAVFDRLEQPYFDPRFNFLGGGDSDLFNRCAATGFKFGWCAEARNYETVPDRRLQADWIRARSLRNGVISTLVEQRHRGDSRSARLRTFCKSLALLGASPFRAIRDCVKSGSLGAGEYRLNVALGRVLAHFGYQNEQYRQPDKN